MKAPEPGFPPWGYRCPRGYSRAPVAFSFAVETLRIREGPGWSMPGRALCVHTDPREEEENTHLSGEAYKYLAPEP